MLGFPDAELSLLFVADSEMRSLNRRYRRIDKTTDVLSFPLQDSCLVGGAIQSPKMKYLPLGDVVISIPKVVEQARRDGRSLDGELLILLVHGVLHLLGYDHEVSLRQARIMQKREKEVQRVLGDRFPSVLGEGRRRAGFAGSSEGPQL